MDRRCEFMRGLFSMPIVCNLKLKTTVIVYEAVASGVNGGFSIDEEMLQVVVHSFSRLFTGASIVVAYRQRLMGAFATMLSRSCTNGAVNPEVLLKTLAFYPVSTTPLACESGDGSLDFMGNDPKYVSLQEWLSKLGNSPSWASSVGAACVSSFVMGQLFPPTSEWSPESCTLETERQMGGAIVLLCTLCCCFGGIQCK